MICVFINMTGTPEGSTESGFMEKPGIEPATPGLQGIAHIHYTTAASHSHHLDQSISIFMVAGWYFSFLLKFHLITL